MAPFITEPICTIFNASVRQGHVPDLYLRPISLTPTLAKILESFVGQWMLEKMHEQIDAQQFCAIKGRSTNHALTSMLHLWSEALDHGDSVCILSVDYSKAFDCIDHILLLNKLISFGIPNFNTGVPAGNKK